MNTFQLCFYGGGKHNELLPGELELDEAVVKDLMNQALLALPSVVSASKVEIEFLPAENIYAICITIHYHDTVKEFFDSVDDLEASIEGVASKALLQIFPEVAVIDCAYLFSV